MLKNEVSQTMRFGHQPKTGGRGSTEPPIRVRVLVLNFDPLVPAEGNKPLHTVLGWNDPRRLAHWWRYVFEFTRYDERGHPLRRGQMAK